MAAVVGRVVATGVGAIVSVPAWTTIGAVAVVDARVAMPGGAPAVIGARGSAAGPRGRRCRGRGNSDQKGRSRGDRCGSQQAGGKAMSLGSGGGGHDGPFHRCRCGLPPAGGGLAAFGRTNGARHVLVTGACHGCDSRKVLWSDTPRRAPDHTTQTIYVPR